MDKISKQWVYSNFSHLLQRLAVDTNNNKKEANEKLNNNLKGISIDNVILLDNTIILKKQWHIFKIKLGVTHRHRQ